MNVYGLTLESCESLIWAIRPEPTLWHSSWGLDLGNKKGDGNCCVAGAYYRYQPGKNRKELMYKLGASRIKNGITQFAEKWFYKIARVLGAGLSSHRASVNLRNLTLWKLREIHAHLLSEAENHGKASGWTPPVIESVPDREPVPC